MIHERSMNEAVEMMLCNDGCEEVCGEDVRNRLAVDPLTRFGGRMTTLFNLSVPLRWCSSESVASLTVVQTGFACAFCL
jgi:hypothetical protein